MEPGNIEISLRWEGGKLSVRVLKYELLSELMALITSDCA